MSFNVRDQLKKNYAVTEPGEEVVISGISGRFPESRNVIELKNNLMNKVDLITDNSTRWRQGNLTWNYHRMGMSSFASKFPNRSRGNPEGWRESDRFEQVRRHFFRCPLQTSSHHGPYVPVVDGTRLRGGYRCRDKSQTVQG